MYTLTTQFSFCRQAYHESVQLGKELSEKINDDSYNKRGASGDEDSDDSDGGNDEGSGKVYSGAVNKIQKVRARHYNSYFVTHSS